MTLLSFLAVALGSRCAFSLGLTERLGGELAASYAAAAGIQKAIGVVKADATPAQDGLSEVKSNRERLLTGLTLGEWAFTLSEWVDEERKLNLNTIPSDILFNLLTQVGGMKASPAQVVADSIEDWRDEDDQTHSDGAEGSYYSQLDQPYPCKDAPLENLEELLLVRGMTPAVYQRLLPFVTVHGAGKVNLNTASHEVLQVLGLSKEGAKGIAFYRAGEDNTEETEDDRVFPSVAAAIQELGDDIPQDDWNRLAALHQMNLLTVGSTEFRVSIGAKTPEGKHSAFLSAVVNRLGEIKAWRQG